MTSLKQALKNKLTKKEKQVLVRSYDVIGDIAIIEIPDELKKKETLIAETLLKTIYILPNTAEQLKKHHKID